ncbi:MAG: MATE family efflux transporter [Succinivibrio sp.]|nr:MATE family efflux transporter [Succinivibrio sp.]
MFARLASRYRDIDMLHGSLWDKLFVMAIPLALTGILQQLFNTADVITLGHYVSDEAMAAVGNNIPIIGLIVSLFMGISIGANVVVARYLGMLDDNNANDAVHTSLIFSVYLGIAIVICGELLSSASMDWLGVPEEVRGHSLTYLRCYLAGMPFMAVYNFEAALFRSKGDTSTPLMALFYASVLNALGNLACVLLTPFGVAGVALCTTLANGFAAYYLFVKLQKAQGPISIQVRKLSHLNLRKLRAIIAIGLPAGIQGMVFSLSNLVIQSAINSLGADVMAASAAAFTIEINIYCTINAFGLSATTFIGQNYGAGNLKRCQDITLISMLLCVVMATLVATTVYILARPLLSLFTTSETVIALGIIRIIYIGLPQGLNAIMEILSGAMRGVGYSLPPALVALFSICGCRLLYVFFIFPGYNTYESLMLVYPLSWVICTLMLIVLYLYNQRRLRKLHELR